MTTGTLREQDIMKLQSMKHKCSDQHQSHHVVDQDMHNYLSQPLENLTPPQLEQEVSVES